MNTQKMLSVSTKFIICDVSDSLMMTEVIYGHQEEEEPEGLNKEEQLSLSKDTSEYAAVKQNLSEVSVFLKYINYVSVADMGIWKPSPFFAMFGIL